MQICPVQTEADLQAFIDLPYHLYQDDPTWVAPLRSEQAAQFEPRRNPMLDHCDYTLFLLKEGSLVMGRISAFTDRLALKHWQLPIGLFGSFECTVDSEGSQMLLGAARDWLHQKGMHWMRGPWSFASQEWGLVVDGFNPPPVILAPYNPPYYNNFLLNFGFQKAKDLLVYYIDRREGYILPERILKLTDLVQKRYGVTTRTLNMKDLEHEVMTIVELTNSTINDNWGFYPVTTDEGRVMAHDLKDIIHPQGVVIAEDPHGRPVGFAMALPDVNRLLRGLDGRMLPFGWLKLLLGLPKLNQYRMWALGVIPEYQGKAIDTLLYRKLYEGLGSTFTRMEINYILEDNDRMNNAVLKLGAQPLRRYRVYEMEI